MSQADRVLDVARRRGARGFTQRQWNQGRGVDGKGAITRLAPRVLELKRRGARFRTTEIQTGARGGRPVIYVLTKDVDA